MLRIDVKEEHFEAAEAFNAEFGAIKLGIIAHDFLENIRAASLIEEESALTSCRRLILLRKEVEKDCLFIITDALAHECLEQRLDVLEGEVALL